MLKDYIVIENSADTVSRISLEKLGFSTKRNDANTIGQFGSGIKYAPIAAVRNNLEWFFTGHDDNGPFTLEYISQKEDGIDCIAYKYGDYIKSSSFTLEAGVLSWEDSFQIIREPIANAIDGSKMQPNGWYNVMLITVDTEDPESMKKLEPKEGVFRVYITASPNLMKIIDNYNLYFAMNREALFENNGTKLFKKIDEKARFYCHGILVREEDKYDSVFDYQFDDITLNEERSVKSLYDLEYSVTRTMCRLTNKELISEYIEVFQSADEDDQVWELVRLSNTTFKWSATESSQEAWQQVWNEKFGPNSVILSQIEYNVSSIRTGLKLKKLKPILVKNLTAYALFKDMGIPTSITSLTQEYHFDVTDDTKDFPRLEVAMKIAERFEPGLRNLNKKIGILNANGTDVLGMVLNMEDEENKRIVIEKSHAQSSTVEELIATIIHEYDHYESGIRDSNDHAGRSFRDLADKRIGKLIYAANKDDILNAGDECVYINYSDFYDVGGFNYALEYSKNLDNYILNIGNKNWILKLSGLPNKHKGVCEISEDGKVISIPFGCKVSIERSL
jgi:hypothetical protein